jgi:hypothetical protein
VVKHPGTGAIKAMQYKNLNSGTTERGKKQKKKNKKNVDRNKREITNTIRRMENKGGNKTCMLEGNKY